jgi:hypothetical protein
VWAVRAAELFGGRRQWLMATASLSLPGAGLIDEAIKHFRWDLPHADAPRRRPTRVADPLPIRVPGIAREVVVKVASEADEWDQAFQLVAGKYRESGYEPDTAKPYRFTPHHALPDSTLFVAKEGSQVVATLTLVPDNTLLGLPMESLYGAEIADLRQQGRRLAEPSSLAFAELGQREFLQVFTTLLRIMMQFHISRGGDTWVITVNPRHRNFYTKVQGYQALGPCKAYSLVGNAPAEAYVVDRDLMRAHAPRSHELMFGDWLSDEVLAGVSLPRALIRYFWGESNQADESRMGAILRAVADYGSPRAW